MLTDIVRPHHTKAQLDLLKVVLDHRELWQQDIISSKEIQKEHFGAWRLIHRGSKVTVIEKKPFKVPKSRIRKLENVEG